ncbi:hypothetical protein F383_08184 [Gossypium arboreum]|uniref:Uncharacterized protein n=1 Tax=Gossypium arboreum TaxID=29729 RepID=A0A0B0N9H8_GOSAR|nr:hypothetical protein F383_08184 [Gossypium arboreum]
MRCLDCHLITRQKVW